MTIKKNKSTAGLYKKLADYIILALNFGLSPLGDMRKKTLMSVLSEQMVPHVTVKAPHGNELKFWCFGGWSSYRGRSVLEKEPLTIKWIESIKPGCLFWDVGANVGTFSIYAAVVKGLKTCAFEPSLSNMAVFSKNIEINKVDHLITALPVALSHATGIDYLSLQSTSAGNTGAQYAGSTIGSPTVFKQACLGWTVDDFIEFYKLPVPNYIKMDVDGLEASILKASPKTLSNPELKSLILEFEVESQDFKDTQSLLALHGFKITESEPTVPGRETMKNFVFMRS